METEHRILQRVFRPLVWAPMLMGVGLLSATALPAVKNLAVVVSTSSKLSDVTVTDLAKLSRGLQKTWPDGKSFTL